MRAEALCICMNLNIQIQERLQTQSYKNLPVSFQRFLITATGKYMWLEPHCQYCGSEKVVQNGYFTCEARIIKELGLRIRHGHYLCNGCQRSFSISYPGLKKFLNDLKRFLQETSFSLSMKGMSFGQIAEYITEQFNMPISDETVRRYYTKIARSFRSRKVLKTSGYFSIDCQHVRIKGEKYARLSVIDVLEQASVIDVSIPAETIEEVMDRLRLLLLPHKVKGIIVDGKRGLVKALKQEIKVPVQRCVMHVQKLIVAKYKNPTLLQLRNMYMLLNILMDHDTEVQFLNNLLGEQVLFGDEKRLIQRFYEFRDDLKRFRRKQNKYLITRTEEEMLDRLKQTKKFLTEKHEKERIKKIEKEWEELTEFLRVKELKPTNNAVEHYYSKTLTKTDKKRFRTIASFENKISACRAVFNKWFRPTITLQEILQKYALLFRLFSI